MDVDFTTYKVLTSKAQNLNPFFPYPPPFLNFNLKLYIVISTTVSAPGLNYHAELGVHTVKTYSLVAMSSVLLLC